MEDKQFQELLKSVQQADAIIKGDLAPSRVFVSLSWKPIPLRLSGRVWVYPRTGLPL